jgi:hypothetical protein
MGQTGIFNENPVPEEVVISIIKHAFSKGSHSLILQMFMEQMPTMRITYILLLHKRCVLCKPFTICHLSMEHNTKIKLHPPDYMRPLALSSTDRDPSSAPRFQQYPEEGLDVGELGGAGQWTRRRAGRCGAVG